MRAQAIGVAGLILAGAAVCGWQGMQIARLRTQIEQQGAALQASQAVAVLPVKADRSIPAQTARADFRADERRLILSEYRGVIAEMNLPPATAAKLRTLLTDRVEAVLDAEDAANREGFAEGSAVSERAVRQVIAEADREIAGLVGQDGSRRLNGLAPAVPLVAPMPYFPSEPASTPPPAPLVPQVTLITYVEPAPAPVEVAPAASAYQPPYTNFFYSYPTVVMGRREARRLGREAGQTIPVAHPGAINATPAKPAIPRPVHPRNSGVTAQLNVRRGQ